MLLEINSKLLSTALKIASKITLTKDTPTLATQCVMLEADEKNLTISATNLKVSYSNKIECSISKPGKTLVNAAKLISLVGTYKNEDLVLKTNPKGVLSVVCGKSEHKFNPTPVENFPKLEAVGNTPFNIPTAIFAEMLRRTSYVVTELEARPNLEGISIELDKNIFRMMSSDSLRIAKVEYTNKENYLVNFRQTIPRITLPELVSILPFGDVLYFGGDDSKIFFKCGTASISSTLLAQDYPSISSILNLDGYTSIEISREKLLSSLSRTAILSDKKSLINEFVFSRKELTLKVEDDESSASEVIEVDCPEEFSVGFKIKQVTEFLSSISSEKVNFHFDDKKNRFYLTEPHQVLNNVYLLPPIKIQ